MTSDVVSTRIATEADVNDIISISAGVQDALTASGSLQQIGPLSHSTVSFAVDEKRCFVATTQPDRIVGSAMVKLIDERYFASSVYFNIIDYPKPWQYLHSIMLVPELQGKGYGLKFFSEILKLLPSSEGTVLLDCWAGNGKLRDFYARAGCQYVATVPEEDWEIAVFVQSLERSSESRELQL